MRLVVERVQVREQPVPHAERVPSRLGHGLPHIQLLPRRREVGMVPGERVERAELDPPVAELLRRLRVEPADVGADHRHAEDAEVEHGGDGVAEILPGALVVAGPVRGVGARPDERGARQDERPLALEPLQRLVRRDGLRESIQAVRVVLQDAIVVRRAGGDGVEAEPRRLAGGVDLVRRLVPPGVRQVLAVQAAHPWRRRVGQRAQVRRRDLAFPGAEVGCLVHVDPEAIHGHKVMKPPHLVDPPRDAIGVEEVREVDGAGPHLRQVWLPVQLDEDVALHAALVHAIGVVHGDAGVDEDNVLHALCMDLVKEFQQLGTRVVHGIKGEILRGVHVIVVVPDHVEGDLRVPVALHDALDH
ncbi:hypothetical protein EE612_000068 [Oryza sativa]|nr:hypothetical protein EE612_000068 [Oryza sativa]